MSNIQKAIIGALTVLVLGAAAYFFQDGLSDPKPNKSDGPENILAEQKDLLAAAEQLQMSIGDSCDNKKEANKKIQEIEKKLADLAGRKKNWLDNVPPLPDIDPDDIVMIPDADAGRPGSEMPELSSDVPPLPDIDDADIIDPDEYILQIAESEKKIINILQALKALCQEETEKPAPKTVSDKCSDACQRYKDCAAYTEDATPADLNDAYDTCLEECQTWPKEMIKCINAVEIKAPNDCVNFLPCQLPQFYEEKYLP